jgi:putative aminopeptidase FrvX
MARAAADEDLLIDVGARSPREVADAGIALLDPVVIGRRVVDLAGGWLAGPALDNRAGCTALLGLLSGLEPVKVKGTLTIAFTAQGLADGRGAQRLAAHLAPDEAVVVDWPAAHEARTTTSKEALLSSGPSVVAPSAGNRLSTDLFARLTQIAGTMSIPLQPLVHSGTAEAAAFAAPVRVGVIGAPILYSGAPGQVADPRDVAALSRLLKAYVEQQP